MEYFSENSPVKIGQKLRHKGCLSPEEIDIVLKRQKRNGRLFGELAVELGFLKENDLVQTLSDIYNCFIVSLEFLYFDHKVLESLPYEIASHSLAIPFEKNGNNIKIAISDPGDIKAIDKITSFFKGGNVEFFVAKKSQIKYFLDIIKYKKYDANDPLFLLNKILFDALKLLASDIHFEPNKNLVRVRVRIDGILQVLTSVDLDTWLRMKAKLKLISDLSITEHRLPQSGHTRMHLGGKIVDMRISTHPGIFGENFVIRIFDLSNGIKSLSELGFLKDDLLWFKKLIKQPSGLLLIVGPTGSGKTTTLYSLLKEINSPSINIMTLEDPVEYHIEGIKQLDLKEDGLLSFADGVKSILRQDPDVLLIGEIRDEETASSAIRAALTGRLVLATLHASNPIEGLRRLVDLNLKLSDFIPSLIGIFSQRLVKKKFDNIKKLGRFPLSEYISFSSNVKEKILNGIDFSNLKMDKTFLESAHEALKNNLTTKVEIRRILGNLDL